MANTNKGRKLYVCVTAQPDDLDQNDYEGLSWVQVGHVGSIGETGTSTNMVNYDTLEDDVILKSKGLSNAGDPQIEMARTPGDAGQIILHSIANTNLDYAFKVEDADAPAGFTNTIYYLRGKIGGPTRPGGRAEDFVLEVYSLAINQRELVVDPEALSVPANVVPPGIAGLADASSGLLYGTVGVWSNVVGSDAGYDLKWQHDTAGNGTGVDIAGETGSTYNPVGGDVGNAIRFGVRAKNSAGTAAGYVYSFWSPLVVA